MADQTPEPETLSASTVRYAAALHAMQSGVAMEMNYDPKVGSPKDLRVGLNSAMVTDAALTKLLIDKGIITLEEYSAANADAMEQERDRYTQRIREHFGHPNINLG